MGKLKPEGKFALIAHPPDMDLYRAYIKHLKPDKTYNDALLLKLFEWAPAYKIKEWERFSLDNRHYSDGLFIMVPFLPEMKDIRLKAVKDKIEQAMQIAADEGCTIAAMGAFTSIIFQGEEEALVKKYGIMITSGNSCTATLIVQSLENLAEKMGFNMADKTVAIIGASGDIGSGCMLYLGSRVKKILATARGLRKLREIVEKNWDHLKCEIKISKDNEKAIQQADIVIFVTSAYTYLARQEDFNPGTIICDASAPVNVKIGGERRKDIFLYRGGIAKIPNIFYVGFDIGLALPFNLFGCLTEGILLSQRGELTASWGRGNISLERINRYMDIMQEENGIKPAITIDKHVYAEEEIKQFGYSMSC